MDWKEIKLRNVSTINLVIAVLCISQRKQEGFVLVMLKISVFINILCIGILSEYLALLGHHISTV